MKFWIAFLFAAITSVCSGQARAVNYINNYYKNNGDDVVVETLAYKLTAQYKTDNEKVRSIFRWITDNISYKVPRRQSRISRVKIENGFKDDADTGILKPLNERVSEIVLRDREAFCDGYARLFKTLCDYAGIRSEIITGFAKGDSRGNFKFKSNHSWNAVFLDSAWRLLDATWASGYFTYSSPDFVQQYNSRYYLTDPEVFLQDHYPEDIRWTLLPPHLSINEFNRSPFHYGAFSKFKINSYLPAKGVIDASVGDTLQFELQTEELPKTFFISDTAFVDTFYTAGEMGVKVPFNITGNRIACTYIVPQEATEWLQVVYDDRIIMRYKLNVRKNSIAVNMASNN